MPDLPPDMSLEQLAGWAVTAHPDLAGARFTILADGWDSVALDVDDRLILKFPRDHFGVEALHREAAVLGVVRPAVDLPVADLRLLENPVLHSIHPKLPGISLLPELYASLDEPARDATAEALGRFFAQLHTLDDALFTAIGIGPAESWLDAATIRERAWHHLPDHLHPWADRALAAWRDLPPDPHGTTFGHFDAHGWNLAFDPDRQRLNGLLDFGDSGFGPLHREFVYSTLIDPDLTLRIIPAYERHSGRALDRDRVLLLADIHRLWEIAVEWEDKASVAAMLPEIVRWAGWRG